ncbi:Type 1 glutamine amidotransferase-like domain-containing protein [Mobilicoccus pelagius]|uniref:Peptidase S51 family protein n=1 Tax=Mobilicoccus pelagius NBRC 104925 TaxID=1089455 RepID=H5UUA1_9MICO|nr:Type 1 glutamine amidotransferase-like domain-containing protein [Mobilicoccus pelagius]GAB49309.1 peptidase S51 family protein [Mobilicoccus pelagius NBRC 104925]
MARSACHSLAAALTLGSLALGAPAFAAPADTAGEAHRRTPETLVPIGGGYESLSLRSYALRVAQQARGSTVDIVVVPSSYGDAPADRAKNLQLAGQRAAQMDAECDAALKASAYGSRFAGCTATLAPLLDRHDAMNPANVAPFTNAETDGVYVLGGDQVLAMKVLANSPAEKAMSAASRRGVVVGGTSAGNAVESRTMGAGYAEDRNPEDGLERDAALLFWGDDLGSDERGLSFGTHRAILDQHFYQRGRFGRLLAYVARSAEHHGGTGKIGIGVDWATGLSIEDDTRLTQPFGYSSSSVVDLSTATAPRWVGPRNTLSVQGVRTHLVAPLRGRAMTYDMPSRTMRLDDHRLPAARPTTLPRLTASGRGTLVLGGGMNATAASAPLRAFVESATPGRPIVLVLAGYADATARTKDADAYTAALRAQGWTGEVRVIRHGLDPLDPAQIRRSAGVLAVGDDQSRMASFVADRDVRASLAAARRSGVAVMTDGAATAVGGQRYVTNPDPEVTTESPEAIAMFRRGDARLAAGLGLVRGYVLEPTLTREFRWGRLFDVGAQRRGTIGAGISERTALVLTDRDARVIGDRSVVTVDARRARWFPSANGALAGTDLFVSTYAPTDRVR